MSTPTETHTKPCEGCGQPVAYEPILIGTRDFGAVLARRCVACEAIEQEKQRVESAAERERGRRSSPPRRLARGWWMRAAGTGNPVARGALWGRAGFIRPRGRAKP